MKRLRKLLLPLALVLPGVLGSCRMSSSPGAGAAHTPLACSDAGFPVPNTPTPVSITPGGQPGNVGPVTIFAPRSTGQPSVLTVNVQRGQAGTASVVITPAAGATLPAPVILRISYAGCNASSPGRYVIFRQDPFEVMPSKDLGSDPSQLYVDAMLHSFSEYSVGDP